jgi:hypothetical protein
VAEKERERLKNACSFWLQGEFAREIKAPAEFYERMRDICLLAETANDEAVLIAIQMFDDLLLETEPPQAWFDFKKRCEE